MDDLARLWHGEMHDIYHSAKTIGYHAAYFIQMVEEMGGLAAAKRLINDDKPSAGFTRLYELRRLDLAVEARALKPEFRALFTPAEVKTSRQRLSEYGVTSERPWEPPAA